MTDTYATIAAKLDTLDVFDNRNSMRAEWIGDTYTVYSYWTVIATYSNANGERTLNRGKYSRTTSRQQGLIARVWGMPHA